MPRTRRTSGASRTARDSIKDSKGGVRKRAKAASARRDEIKGDPETLRRGVARFTGNRPYTALGLATGIGFFLAAIV